MAANARLPTPANQPQAEASRPRIEISDTTMTRLAACGALTALRPIQGVELESLDDSYVHPIFAREYWLPGTIMDERWQMMRPALILASFFIWEETELFDYFVRIFYARRRQDPAGPKQVHLDDMKVTDALRQKTADRLEEMAEVTRISVSRNAGNMDEMAFDETLYGKMLHRLLKPRGPLASRRYRGPSRGWSTSAKAPVHVINIWITQAYFAKLSAAGTSRDSRRRVLFALAKTLVHELCHAFWRFGRAGKGRPEPRVFASTPVQPDSEKGFELGRQWHYYALGMHVKYHERSLPLPEPLLSVYLGDNPGTSAFVLMDYVDQWFTWETWNKLAEEGLQGRPKAAISTTYRLKRNPSDRSIRTVKLPRVQEEPEIGEDSREDARRGTNMVDRVDAMRMDEGTAEPPWKKRKL